MKFLLNCVKESDFNSLHAWTIVFHIFNINLTNLETGGCKLSYKLNVAPPAWFLDAVGYLGIVQIGYCAKVGLKHRLVYGVNTCAAQA